MRYAPVAVIRWSNSCVGWGCHDREGFSFREGFSSNKRKILRDHARDREDWALRHSFRAVPARSVRNAAQPRGWPLSARVAGDAIDVPGLQRRLENQGAYLGRTAPEAIL